MHYSRVLNVHYRFMAKLLSSRVKPIDLSYCMECLYYKCRFRANHDFCLYDGKKIIQADGVNFIFACKQFHPMIKRPLSQY